MKKVIIWDKSLYLKDAGGPSGYLYKLHNYLQGNKNEAIDFYSDLQLKEKKLSTCNKKRHIVEYLKKIRIVFFIYTVYKTYFKQIQLSSQDVKILSNYQYVHVHTLPDALNYYKGFKAAGCKLILTTHMPEPFTNEFFNSSGYSYLLKYIPFLRNYLIRREVRAFDVADFIMFPVPEAKEAYTDCSREYEKVFKRNEKKFFYVPTAIEERYKSSNLHTLDQFKIDENVLKVCFIGRHNAIKGYDNLKEIALEVWKDTPDVHFFIGGKEEPIKGLNHTRWHELGWVSTYDLLNEIDVFILPNKSTYFDLILLEVMRAGKVVVLSNTGGNKWFRQFDNTGLYFYDYGDINAVTRIISELWSLKQSGNLENCGQKNRNLFCSTSLFKTYLNKYIAQLNLID